MEGARVRTAVSTGVLGALGGSGFSTDSLLQALVLQSESEMNQVNNTNTNTQSQNIHGQSHGQNNSNIQNNIQKNHNEVLLSLSDVTGSPRIVKKDL